VAVGRRAATQGRVLIVVSWIAAAASMGYLLPWAVATTRHQSASASIGWLNLLLGWTGVGWIVAFVRACAAEEWASDAAGAR
jgi:Superinfection immunity protein